MFAHGRPIYQQIRDMIVTEIISGRWKEGDLIPSVRVLSTDLGVNPNTVLHTLGDLQKEGVLEMERGVGNRVAAGAAERLAGELKRDFQEREMRNFIKRARLLGFTQKALYTAMERIWNDEKKAWIDDDFKEENVITIQKYSDEYFDLIDKNKDLIDFLQLKGTVYLELDSNYYIFSE